MKEAGKEMAMDKYQELSIDLQMDKITLDTALQWQAWMMIWAVEPQRKICVEMTYDDLVRIVNLMKEAWKRNN